MKSEIFNTEILLLEHKILVKKLIESISIIGERACVYPMDLIESLYDLQDIHHQVEDLIKDVKY